MTPPPGPALGTPAADGRNQPSPAPVVSPCDTAGPMDEPTLDVPACVARVKEGDEDAARVLMQHLYPLVISVVRGHLPRRTSEEDLVQMIYIKVFSKLDQYAGKVPLSHWVSRIAVNTCLNALQSERIRPELRWSDLREEEEFIIQSLASTSEEVKPGHELAAREIVDKLMETLRPQDRLLIQWLHLEGRSIEEIRQRTGWNISMIKVRAFRARRRLRKLLDQLTR
ncbi:MAG: hypothetical protein RJA22_2160 [Verrucomicrobiota bacterium]